MIDQAFSSEIEARVRTAFDEMVPKLLDPTTDTTREPGEVVDQMTVREVHAHPRSSRGVLAAGLMVAASLVGLVVVAQRDTDRV